VDAATRNPVIQAIARAMLPLTESDADAVLTTAGSERITPTNWGNEPPMSRRIVLLKLLQELPDEVLANLQLGLSDETKIARSRPGESPTITAKSIFVVHGHAHGAMHETVRVLERATGLEVIVLHEQPNSGRTILEKFEDFATDASYAVVLLTADDVGSAAAIKTSNPRGRQNVIFELGFFFGKLGRNRVAVLIHEGVEKPSDIDGLVYITLDSSGAWKQALARELRSAKIDVDYSRLP
jgi:predicted nucleotide-binding protein